MSSWTWLVVWFCCLLHSVFSYPVRVQVDQTIPDITPRQAKNAWLSYQWEQGGGLLLRVKQESELERTLQPFGIQETLLSSRVDEVRYRMTELGALQNYLISNSHQASVEFIEEEDYSTTLVWIVEFEAKTSVDAQFWAFVTEVNLKTILGNLDTYLGTPQLYRQTTRLSPRIAVDELAQEWIDFVWKQGGGLPLPSPQELDDERRMTVPPFLVERLVDVEPDEVCYTVDNPGLFTYQVLTHKGRVRFEQDATTGRDVQMVWEVEIRPFRGWAWIVEPFTASVITTLARNFKVHVNEPGATVKLSTSSGGNSKQGKNRQGTSARPSSFAGGETDDTGNGQEEKEEKGNIHWRCRESLSRRGQDLWGRKRRGKNRKVFWSRRDPKGYMAWRRARCSTKEEFKTGITTK